MYALIMLMACVALWKSSDVVSGGAAKITLTSSKRETICAQNNTVMKQITIKHRGSNRKIYKLSFACGKHKSPLAKTCKDTQRNKDGTIKDKKIRKLCKTNKEQRTDLTKCRWQKSCIVDRKKTELSRGAKWNSNGKAIDMLCCNATCAVGCKSVSFRLKKHRKSDIKLKSSEFLTNITAWRTQDNILLNYTKCTECLPGPIPVPVVVISTGPACINNYLTCCFNEDCCSGDCHFFRHPRHHQRFLPGYLEGLSLSAE